jgi:excisionase family DNA binding protein
MMNEPDLESLFGEERFLTPREVADLLQVPLNTLQTWRANRSGPRGHKIGRHVRYRASDVQTWLEQRADRVFGDATA